MSLELSDQELERLAAELATTTELQKYIRAIVRQALQEKKENVQTYDLEIEDELGGLI